MASRSVDLPEPVGPVMRKSPESRSAGSSRSRDQVPRRLLILQNLSFSMRMVLPACFSVGYDSEGIVPNMQGSLVN